jgi:hypothetical protein
MSESRTRAEEDAILAQAEAIEEKRREEYRARAEAVEQRIKGNGDPFKDEELVYAASSRCKCGAGFAYPEHIGMHGAWYCSHLLKTRDPHGDHDSAMPFAFWSVRSESQIARNNGIVTTRPKGAPWGAHMLYAIEQEKQRRAQYNLAPLDESRVSRPGANPTEDIA